VNKADRSFNEIGNGTKHDYHMHRIQAALLLLSLASPMTAQITDFSYQTSPIKNLGPETGVMRRDPSDIIKVGQLYYVWYTKGAQDSGYDATIWYASSPDGHNWIEKGEALSRGPKGNWDEQSVFTPNIMVAEGQYWLFYTAVPKPFANDGPNITKTAIGIAVSESPDGPWTKLKSNPILRASEDPEEFDSLRVDDACLIVRGGSYWLYYKGRQWGNTPGNTKMGVAVADEPKGPYFKQKENPVVGGGHEVLVWPYGEGVVALIGNVGPKGTANTLQYAPDGLSFSKMRDLEKILHAPGAYRPDAFADNGKGTMIQWGVHIGGKRGFLPFLERFECTWRIESDAEPSGAANQSQPVRPDTNQTSGTAGSAR